GNLAPFAVVDSFSVPENRQRIRNYIELLEAMRDVNHGESSRPQISNKAKELLHLVRRQRRGRLVHNDHATGLDNCSRDLDQLPVSRTQPPHRSTRVYPESILS